MKEKNATERKEEREKGRRGEERRVKERGERENGKGMEEGRERGSRVVQNTCNSSGNEVIEFQTYDEVITTHTAGRSDGCQAETTY